MTLNQKLAMLGGFLTAVLYDVTKYRAAKAKNPDEKFDWFMAGLRWVMGAVAGATAGQVAG